MSQELEIAAEYALGAEAADAAAKNDAPENVCGGPCANCGASLQGAYCHICGQNADDHKRSILHLAWEGIEGFLHLDGRLRRTLPDLFFHPGRLARDYMDGRIARHVPPFRTFLVALLIFIFAAEHATHEIQAAQDTQTKARAAQLATPQGRAQVAAQTRAEAIKDRPGDLADAAKDRDDDLKDPDENRAKVLARYAEAVARVNDDYARAMAKADRIAQGQPPQAATVSADLQVEQDGKVHRLNWFKDGLHRAIANPEYYLTVMFAWGHRLAILLLPILGLSLALVYPRRRGIFLYDHLLVAMNLLSFAFLTNAAALLLPPSLVWPALGLVALWTPVNLYQTLRGAYGSSILGAALKTVVVWWISVTSFFVLMAGVMLVALAQV